MTEKPTWEIQKEIKAKAIEKAKQVFREAGLQVTIDRSTETNGMSLRDYFAGQALNGILAHTRDHTAGNQVTRVHKAYQYADEMLKQRGR